MASISTLVTWAIYFGDLFGGMFGGGSRSRRNSNGPRRGADVRVNVRITFARVSKGNNQEDRCYIKG